MGKRALHWNTVGACTSRGIPVRKGTFSEARSGLVVAVAKRDPGMVGREEARIAVQLLISLELVEQ
jgi:hypothetical protein